MFQLFISVYVALPFLATFSLKERLSALWQLVYALPVFLALLALVGQCDKVVCQGLLVMSLVLAWLIRPLAGQYVFGKVHLSHFIVHGVISLLLILGLFFF